MAETTYTNVGTVAIGSTSIAGVKSISVSEQYTFINSRADGARGPKIVGAGNHTITGSIEIESQGAFPAPLVFGYVAAPDNLTFLEQNTGVAGTTKTHTITDVMFGQRDLATSDTDPNAYTLNFQNTDPDDTWTIS